MNKKNLIVGLIVGIAILVVLWSIYASRGNKVQPVMQAQGEDNPHAVDPQQAAIIEQMVLSPAGTGLSVAECTSDTAAAVRGMIEQLLTTGMPMMAVAQHMKMFGYELMMPDTSNGNPPRKMGQGSGMPDDAIHSNLPKAKGEMPADSIHNPHRMGMMKPQGK